MSKFQLPISIMFCFVLGLILCGCAVGPRGVNKNLLLAAESGSTPPEVERLLVKGANVNARDKYGNTPLHSAASYGHKDVAELLIVNGANVNAEAKSGATPLFFAAYYGHRDVAELLIAKGADVNTKADIWHGTPLHATAYPDAKPGGEVHPLATVLQGRKDVAELLIAKGADVNAKAFFNETPLHV